ncbi:MAG TPA: hypothetical protein VGP47_02875 [Parachlamydiaceae bacterium]|nr:hypothetical protein [Parachlamydiaceae bacterium]
MNFYNSIITLGFLALFGSACESSQPEKIKKDVEKRGNVTKETISSDQMQAIKNNCAIIKLNLSQEFGGHLNNEQFNEALHMKITEYLDSVGAPPSTIDFLFLQ